MQRCHQCNLRYVRFGSSMVGLADLRRISERLLLAIGMATAAALVMAVILWFSHAPLNDTGRLAPDEQPVSVELYLG